MSKRIAAFIMDAFLLLIITTGLFSLINTAFQTSDIIKETNSKRIRIQNESHLFIDGENINSYVDDEKLSGFTSYRQKKDFLSNQISCFYTSSYFFLDDAELKLYNERRLEYRINGESIFRFDGNKIVEKETEPKLFYDFYKNEITNHCLRLLYNSSDYASTTTFFLLFAIIEFSGCLFVSFAIYAVVIPLALFKRGRQTIGKKVFKISLLSVKALNITPGIFILRETFFFVTYIIFGFFSFLLPEFISLGMLLFSARKQGLVDYVFNQYHVDSSNKDVYFTSGEYYARMGDREKAKLENKDFDITNQK